MAITREITITYGSYSIGGSTGRHPVPSMRFTRDYDSATFTCDFVIQAASPSALATAVLAAQDALRKPRQDLTVSMGGTSLVEWKHSTNTGLNTDPTCEKVGDPTDSGCKQKLRMTVACEMPADNLSLAGRRTSDIRVEYDENRKRTLTITGEYTALSSNSATDQYTAAADTYCASVRTAQGGEWNLIDEFTAYMETDKVLQFRRVYREIIYAEVDAASLDNANVTNQNFQLELSKSMPGDSTAPDGTKVARLQRATATYSATLDWTATTDLDTFVDSVKTWIFGKVSALGGAGRALVEDTSQTFPDDNRVEVRQVWEIANNRWMEYTLTQVSDTDFGVVMVPVWEDVRPGNYVRYRYQGPGSLRLTAKENGVHYGTLTAGETTAPTLLPPPNRHEWVKLQERENFTAEWRGETYRFEATKYDRQGIYEAQIVRIFTPGSGLMNPLLGY